MEFFVPLDADTLVTQYQQAKTAGSRGPGRTRVAGALPRLTGWENLDNSMPKNRVVDRIGVLVMNHGNSKDREGASREYTDEQLAGFFDFHEAEHTNAYDQAPEAYDAWARAHFRAPHIITERLIELCIPRDARILDFGAGSGHSGQVLYDLGYRNVVAFDVSSGMLAVARAREVYVDIRCDRALPEEPVELYDAIVASGVFAGGTPAAEAELRSLLAHLRPGGIIVLNNRVNNEHGRRIHTVLFQMLTAGELSSLHAKWEDDVVDLIEHRRQLFFVLRKP